jgi:hypothetical protein
MSILFSLVPYFSKQSYATDYGKTACVPELSGYVLRNKFGALSSNGEADVKYASNRSESQVCIEEMSRELSYYSSSFIEV